MNKKIKTTAIERKCTTSQILYEAYCIVARLLRRFIRVRIVARINQASLLRLAGTSRPGLLYDSRIQSTPQL